MLCPKIYLSYPRARLPNDSLKLRNGDQKLFPVFQERNARIGITRSVYTNSYQVSDFNFNWGSINPVTVSDKRTGIKDEGQHNLTCVHRIGNKSIISEFAVRRDPRGTFDPFGSRGVFSSHLTFRKAEACISNHI